MFFALKKKNHTYREHFLPSVQIGTTLYTSRKTSIGDRQRGQARDSLSHSLAHGGHMHWWLHGLAIIVGTLSWHAIHSLDLTIGGSLSSSSTRLITWISAWSKPSSPCSCRSGLTSLATPSSPTRKYRCSGEAGRCWTLPLRRNRGLATLRGRAGPLRRGRGMAPLAAGAGGLAAAATCSNCRTWAKFSFCSAIRLIFLERLSPRWFAAGRFNCPGCTFASWSALASSGSSNSSSPELSVKIFFFFLLWNYALIFSRTIVIF